MFPLRLFCLLGVVALSTATLPGRQEAGGPPRLDAFGDPLPAGAIGRIGSTRFRVPEGVAAVQFAGDGKSILARTQKSDRPYPEFALHLFDAASGKPLNGEDPAFHKVMVPTWTNGVWSISRDGKWLAKVERIAPKYDEWELIVLEVATNRRLLTHTDPGRAFTAMQFTPDGKYLVTAAREPRRADGPSKMPAAIRVWDVSAAKEIRTLAIPDLKKDTWEPWSLTISQDGRFLAASGLVNGHLAHSGIIEGTYESTWVWEMSTGKLLSNIKDGDGGPWAFSPDGSKLAGGRKGTLQMWDPRTGKQTGELAKIPADCRALEFSPNNKYLMARGRSENGLWVTMWELTSGKEVDLPLQGRFKHAGWLFSEDSRTLVLHTETTLTVCDANGVTPRWTDAHSFGDEVVASGYRETAGGMDKAVRISPDGKTLVAAGEAGQLRRWDLATGKEILPPGPKTSVAWTMAFSPDGRKVLAYTGYGLFLHEVEGGQKMLALALPKTRSGYSGNWSDRIPMVGFSSDGRRAAAGWADGMVAVWDTASGKSLWQTQPDKLSLESLAFSADDRAVIVAGATGKVVWYDATTGNIGRILELTNDKGGPTKGTSHVCLTPGARTVIVRNPTHGRLEEWELASGLKRRDIDLSISPLAVSPGGRYLLGPAKFGRTAYDLLTGTELRSFHLGSASLSPDGRTLAGIVSPGTVHFCDLATGTVFGQVRGHPGGVESIAFAPDGKSLAAGCGDGTILIWKTPTFPSALGPLEIANKPPLPLPKPLPAKDSNGEPLPTGARARLGPLNFQTGATASGLRYLPDGKTLVARVSSSVIFVDSLTGKQAGETVRLRGYGSKTEALTKDGKKLAAFNLTLGQAFQQRDGTSIFVVGSGSGAQVHVFDMTTGKVASTTFPKPVAFERVRLQLSPDGNSLAVVSERDGGVLVFDSAMVKEKRRLSSAGAESFQPRWAEFSPNGRFLVVGGTKSYYTPEIRCWDVEKGQGPCWLSGLTGQIAISPDSKWLAAPVPGVPPKESRLVVLELETGKEVHDFGAIKGEVQNLCFSPDGKQLVALIYGKLRRWNTADGKELPNMGMTHAEMAGYSPDGRILAVAERRGGNYSPAILHLFSAADGRELHRLPITVVLSAADGQASLNQGFGAAFAFSPDGTRIAATHGLATRQWDVATGKEIGTTPQVEQFRGLATSQDGRIVAAFDDTAVKVWDTSTGKMLFRLEAWLSAQIREASVVAVAVSPSGRNLAAGGSDGTIRVFDAHSGERRRQLRLHKASVGALTWKDDVTLVSADQAGVVATWHTTDGRLIASLSSAEPGAEKRRDYEPNPALSSGGDFLAMPSWGEMCTISLVGGKRSPPFSLGQPLGLGGAQCYKAPALSPDGRVLAVPLMYHGHSDVLLRWQSLHLFDARTGKLLRSLTGISDVACLAFSPDATLLAACGEGGLRVWETATGTVRADLAGHRGKVTALTFSGDGRTLFSAATDGTVLAWDLDTLLHRQSNQPLATLSLAELWEKLASPDPSQAWPALQELLARPVPTAAFFKEHLQPVAAIPENNLAEMIAALDDNRPKVRQAAAAELAKTLDLAEPALRKFLAGTPTLEQRLRIEQLLPKLHDPVTNRDTLRTLRAIEVLEMIGSSEAAAILTRLAEGAPPAVVTLQARAALVRLAERATK